MASFRVSRHLACGLRAGAGGTTPRAVYRRLAEMSDLPWKNIEIYFGDERAVPRVGAIVDQPPPGKVGHDAAGFVHQKVGCRKVPVVAVAAGDGDIEDALRYAGKPQGERTL